MTVTLLYISDQAMLWAVAVAALLSGILAYLFWKERRKAAQPPAPQQEPYQVLPLRLQAYERLILLAERIALPNLIQRVGRADISAAEMQQILVHTIRQEYDHNITQQIYVSPEAWHALSSFKEQNIMIINKVAGFMSAEASAQELNRHLLELLANTPGASLHNVVAEALSFEAKKLM